MAIVTLKIHQDQMIADKSTNSTQPKKAHGVLELFQYAGLCLFLVYKQYELRYL